MNIVIGVIKAILVRMATKYAADLVVTHTIKALEKAAADTATTIDDELVAKFKAEKDFIVETINGVL
jgi:hypothetical protein